MKIAFELAHYIKEKINGRMMTLTEYAEHIGVSRSTLTAQLNGKKDISLSQISKITTELNMSIYLVDNKNQRTFKVSHDE